MQAGADREFAAADRSGNRERENHTTSLQGSCDHSADVLPLEKRIRRPKAGSSETNEGTGAGECEAEAPGGGAVFGEANSEGRGRGKLLSPERRRSAVRHACENYQVTERHAC